MAWNDSDNIVRIDLHVNTSIAQVFLGFSFNPIEDY